MSELVEWPERLPFDSYDDEIDYERARAEAAIARLCRAMEVLKAITECVEYDDDGIAHNLTDPVHIREKAMDAFYAIGPLPDETKP